MRRAAVRWTSRSAARCFLMRCWMTRALPLLLVLGCEPDGGSLSVAQARRQADGTTARIDGYVTAVPGTFESATGDPGFVMQDGTGGIYVQLSERLALPMDGRVRVTGTLADVAGFRVLQSTAANVVELPGMRSIAPVDVRTGDVGEATEGSLIRVEAAVTQVFQDDSPYGYKLYLNDGSGEVQLFVHVSAGVDANDLRALTVGQTLRATGISAQYATTFEVAPRRPSDIVPR